MENETSEASPRVAEVTEVEVIAAGSPERLAAKEQIKLAFISGKASLTHLARQYVIPYTTLARWSKNERWGEQKDKIATQSSEKTVETISDWVTEQRMVQIKRAVTRAGKLQEVADELLKNRDSDFDAYALQALASAEERADNIVRRNLGMEGQQGGGSSVSINILAGGVQIA